MYLKNTRSSTSISITNFSLYESTKQTESIRSRNATDLLPFPYNSIQCENPDDDCSELLLELDEKIHKYLLKVHSQNKKWRQHYFKRKY